MSEIAASVNTGRPLRALICEDEGMIAMQLRNALRVSGYEVAGEANEGDAAVTLARDVRPDFVLMDVRMPGMDGIEATRKILEERSIPVIMLTAFGDEDSVRRAMDAGACAYLVKPITKEQLIPAVQAGMAQFGALQQTREEKTSLKKALKETIARQTTAATEATRAALRSNAAASETVREVKGASKSTAEAPKSTNGQSVNEDVEMELLAITRRMLEAIHSGDVKTYRALSTDDLTAFETDVAPYRIEGVDFHADLMDAMKAQRTYDNLTRFDILSPRVQVYRDAAIVTYTRLMTYAGPTPVFRTFNETRVFVRQNGAWKMAHFHRSQGG